MTSSPDHHAAREKVARLRTVLAEDQLQHVIDARIDQAVAQFTRQVPVAVTREQFHAEAARFVQHVYEHGLRLPQRLSTSDALAEALALIEAGYPGRPQDRYQAALLDAGDQDTGGLERVWAYLAEVLKCRERQRYLVWAVLSVFDPTDWAAKCAAVETLRRQSPHLFPPTIAALSTPELANDLLRLLSVDGELDDRDTAIFDWLGL